MVLDTNAGQWVTTGGGTGEDFTRRCRHAVASVGPFVFIYGGLKGSQLLDDLLVSSTTVSRHQQAYSETLLHPSAADTAGPWTRGE